MRKVRIAAAAQLGRRYAGQPVGYRVLRLDRRPLDGRPGVAFERKGVQETSIPGHYVVCGGVDVPITGGYILWGFAGRVLAEATIAPIKP